MVGGRFLFGNNGSNDYFIPHSGVSGVTMVLSPNRLRYSRNITLHSNVPNTYVLEPITLGGHYQQQF